MFLFLEKEVFFFSLFVGSIDRFVALHLSMREER